MVDVDGADIAIISGYSNANVLTAKALHHFWFNTDVFIYGDCQFGNADMSKRRSWHQVDCTIQEVMPCFIQCRTWLS